MSAKQDINFTIEIYQACLSAFSLENETGEQDGGPRNNQINESGLPLPWMDLMSMNLTTHADINKMRSTAKSGLRRDIFGVPINGQRVEAPRSRAGTDLKRSPWEPMRNLGKLFMIVCYHYFFIYLMVLPSLISGQGEDCKATIKGWKWKNVTVTVSGPGITYNPHCQIRIPKISQCTGYCKSEDILVHNLDLKTLNMKSACHCCKIEETIEIVTPPQCHTSRGYQLLRSIKDYTYIKVKSCRCKTTCNDTKSIKSLGLTPQNFTVNVRTNDSYHGLMAQNSTGKMTSNDSRVVTSEFYFIIVIWICCYVFLIIDIMSTYISVTITPNQNNGHAIRLQHLWEIKHVLRGLDITTWPNLQVMRFSSNWTHKLKCEEYNQYSYEFTQMETFTLFVIFGRAREPFVLYYLEVMLVTEQCYFSATSEMQTNVTCNQWTFWPTEKNGYNTCQHSKRVHRQVPKWLRCSRNVYHDLLKQMLNLFSPNLH